ncbi:hypothetical protein CA13_65310 [Planctomycetes bacterium CA13]|uniref:Uncharacterized protein n=1 Tax=Novipirellula herctigrandis TaxID=2527986 RepID=A0A5C5ZCA8_9BACT|nr:hypothetical protein CA13_65310 [Planctomycetes bacterium CA13]
MLRLDDKVPPIITLGGNVHSNPSYRGPFRFWVGGTQLKSDAWPYQRRSLLGVGAMPLKRDHVEKHRTRHILMGILKMPIHSPFRLSESQN